jgi:hypothetical protein
VLEQFKISKGEKTPDCSRLKRSETGDDASKERKTERGIESGVFTIL